jgi:hypothetical protein
MSRNVAPQLPAATTSESRFLAANFDAPARVPSARNSSFNRLENSVMLFNGTAEGPSSVTIKTRSWAFTAGAGIKKTASIAARASNAIDNREA